MIQVPVLIFLGFVAGDLLIYLWLIFVFASRTRRRHVPDLQKNPARPSEDVLRRLVVPYRRNERESDCRVCRPRAHGPAPTVVRDLDD
jgi:hypothetical protein